MADAIVGPLLSKLQGVAVTEAKALAAVGNEIDRLRDKLMWLHALVHETDLRSRSDSNQQIRVLAYQVREVAFAAEDAIDHFFLQADLSRFGHDWRQATSIFFSNLGTQIRVRYILSRKIKSMNTRLEDIVDNSAKYRSDSDDGTTKIITWRASRAIPPVRHNWDDTDLEKYQDTKAGGPIRKEEEKKLKDLLLNQAGSHVIYVVGESGIGKRYLAQKVYKNIKGNFHVHVWASFPPGGTINMIGEIKRKLKDKCSKLEPSVESMDQVKYLVVVDCPMSSTMLGDSIAREDLLKGAQGSKIVLTATSSSRADNNNVHVGIIKLGYLKNPKSETLFNRILGLRGRKQTTYKTSMMNKIRNRIEPISKGLPLAVALLAKFMRTMDHSKWEAASEYIQMNNQDNVLMTMVSMCIDDLPNEHRSCLLYTAGFLARSTIDASQLVRLWVAEGFLSQQHGVSQEELGQRYLKEFIFRGLMQLVKKKGDVVESVAIHDLVHQIFRSEAQRTGLMETHNGGEYASVTVSARRLALNNSKMPYKTNILWKVRTLLFHDPQGIMGDAKLKLPSRAHVDKIKEGANRSQKLKEGSNQLLKESTSHDAQAWPQEFKEGFRQLLNESTFLRVISLEGINIGEKLPNRIGNMLHLQYLSVRCSNLTTVPDTIGKLKKLQTMDVRGTQVKKFPTSFWKIKTLRHVLGNHDLQFHGFCQASEDVVIDQGQDHGLSVHMTIKEHVANVHVSSRRSWMLVST
ncbi:disease resistance protein PIK6-NP-like isoform X1 [Hordeum vulgare subsp. vulgare]|uniref:disease resistance protein PIK6-NP-like isoform X1 n=1 Tax=Hordeum vulgare subsp. vulgare TaxID=112509 RepID=UPI001D1A5897|nr:disease resistance protein PIK6-NP-like isoform X1 [Hordeum vulgare subsp. vulgare]